MSKLDQLLGLANNLADSFVSVSNIAFFHYIESLPKEKTGLFEIDLLEGRITPSEINSNEVQKVIQNYKNWFLSEIKKLNIEPNEVEGVVIKIAYKPGKSFAKYYTCNVAIRAKGKDYTKKVMSSYS
jgi:hypothetical protein